VEKLGKIGVFDSGFGGLTILREFVDAFPMYDYVYLGDNARAPYGNKSFDLIYEYTIEGVRYLFDQGCELVILACNTASAKALRTIQQKDLPKLAPTKRVLGVIRPSNMRMVVVLPDPLGPTKPHTVPKGTSKLICETAKRSSYFFERSETEIAVLGIPLTLPQLGHEQTTLGLSTS
jgi:hypothetical protein